jgi:pimeloyl-ACP methyl ester carboxylesterase
MRVFALLLAACAASTLNWSAPASAEPATLTTSAEQRLPHISIVAMGSGSPVVLIPGLSSPRAVWDGIAPRLAADHTVYLVQVNGFGGDDPGANLQPGVLDGIVADLHDYLAAHKAEPARVIGHSMGGLVAIKLALAHPDSVAGLMIVDALPFFGTVFDDKATVDSVRPMAETMRTRMLASAAAIKARAANPVSTDPGGDMSMKPDVRIRIANWSMKAEPAVVAQAVYEDVTTDLRSAIAAIAAPMTILYHTGGDEAGLNARIYARDYAAQPNAKLIPVPDAAHFIMLDQPDTFAAAVEQYVR